MRLATASGMNIQEPPEPVEIPEIEKRPPAEDPKPGTPDQLPEKRAPRPGEEDPKDVPQRSPGIEPPTPQRPAMPGDDPRIIEKVPMK
ncbi:MAG: hypothetical protein ABI551_18015 [Polyangiaceae bacterium]